MSVAPQPAPIGTCLQRFIEELPASSGCCTGKRSLGETEIRLIIRRLQRARFALIEIWVQLSDITYTEFTAWVKAKKREANPKHTERVRYWMQQFDHRKAASLCSIL